MTRLLPVITVVLGLLGATAGAHAAALDPSYAGGGRLRAGPATAALGLPGDRLALARPGFALGLLDARGRTLRWSGAPLAAGGGASAMAAAPDGSIVLAGGVPAVEPTPERLGDLAVARFTSAGLPDARFGSGGLAVVPGAPPATAVAVQPDGGVVVGTQPLALVRLASDGRIDPAFGAGGRTAVPEDRLPVGDDVFVEHLLADGSGRLTAFGRYEQRLSEPLPATVVAHFGTDGMWTGARDLGFPVEDVVLRRAGDFLAVGSSSPYVRDVYGDPSPWRLATLGLSDGPRKPGRRRVPLTDGAASVIGLASDGGILIGGTGIDGVAGESSALLTRLTRAGRRDARFGACGTASLPSGLDLVAIQEQRSGRIVVVELERNDTRRDPVAQVVAVRPDGGRPAGPILPATFGDGALQGGTATARRFAVPHRPAVAARLTAQLRILGLGRFQYVPLSDRNLRRLRLPRVLARASGKLVACREGRVVLRVGRRTRARLAGLRRSVALELRTRVASAGGARSARKRVTLLVDGSLTD